MYLLQVTKLLNFNVGEVSDRLRTSTKGMVEGNDRLRTSTKDRVKEGYALSNRLVLAHIINYLFFGQITCFLKTL